MTISQTAEILNKLFFLVVSEKFILYLKKLFVKIEYQSNIISE